MNETVDPSLCYLEWLRMIRLAPVSPLLPPSILALALALALEYSSRFTWRSVGLLKFFFVSPSFQDVCHKYWPTRGIEKYGSFEVCLLEQTMQDGFLERIYSVTDTGVSEEGDLERRWNLDMQSLYTSYFILIPSLSLSPQSGLPHRVSQFQVVNWDKHGVTFNMMAVLNIINHVDSLKRANQSGPIVVHCR